MFFVVLFMADWHEFGGCSQSLPNCGNQCKNNQCIDYNYKVGDKILVEKKGILNRAESKYGKEPWTISYKWNY
jgi:hypothetical protein